MLVHCRWIFVIASGRSLCVLDMTIKILRKILARDPNSPKLLNYFIEKDIITNSWKSCRSRSVILRTQLLENIVDFLSEIAITSEGLRLIVLINPFQLLSQIFLDPIYLQSSNPLLLESSPKKLIMRLTSLLKLYPDLVPMLLSIFVDTLNKLCEFASDDATLTVTDIEVEDEATAVHFMALGFIKFMDSFFDECRQCVNNKLIANDDFIINICKLVRLCTGRKRSFYCHWLIFETEKILLELDFIH